MSPAYGIELEKQQFLHYVQNYSYVRDAFDEFRAGRTAGAATP